MLNGPICTCDVWPAITSPTTTVLVAVAVLPSRSVTVAVTVYVPSVA